jgi:hypothetical protein
MAIAERNQAVKVSQQPGNYKTVFCKFYGKGKR